MANMCMHMLLMANHSQYLIQSGTKKPVVHLPVKSSYMLIGMETTALEKSPYHARIRTFLVDVRLLLMPVWRNVELTSQLSTPSYVVMYVMQQTVHAKLVMEKMCHMLCTCFI